jgi:hypothetical protein
MKCPIANNIRILSLSKALAVPHRPLKINLSRRADSEGEIGDSAHLDKKRDGH